MRRNAEDGFVLISAMWLLLLGAAIAALLMLRSMTASRDFRAEADRFAQEHAQSDAIEAVAADLVFKGQASPWSQLPANGTLTLDGRTIQATAISEQHYIDVNQADAKSIDGALQDHGYDAAARMVLLGRIAIARATGRRIASYAELVALGHGIVASGSEDCLLNVISPFGGLGQPSLGAIAVRPGSVVRVSFGESAHRHLQTLRLVAANDRPYALLDDYETSCGAGA